MIRWTNEWWRDEKNNKQKIEMMDRMNEKKGIGKTIYIQKECLSDRKKERHNDLSNGLGR